eukprot:TRINITY_DN84630_c0_g1_i1.p1 TRINITY_DN84630_c0_g1~~TRINITY_DN84630_c0_g1_i1.p1  ORF type:complete len:448 (+),score=91.56 TRINITY_DN84630_c0_g1_i1:197-1540(+)
MSADGAGKKQESDASAPLLRPPNMEHMHAFRANLCRLGRELLVTKSSSFMAGITLHFTITFTVIAIVFQGNAVAVLSPTSSPDGTTMAKAYAVAGSVYIGLLCGTVFLNKFIQRIEQLPQRNKDTYCAGLNLIPAWAWRDVIANIFATLVIYKYINKDNAAHLGLFAVGISMLAATLYMGLQAATSGLDKASFPRCVVNSLMTSLAMGCGWALDTAIRGLIGPASFKKLDFCVFYAITGMILTPILQYALNELTKLAKEVSFLPVAFCKGLEFLGLACNFVMGWGIKTLLEVKFQGMKGGTLPDELLAATYISFLCILIPSIIGLLGAPEKVNTSLAMGCGMTIGATWVGFTMAVMKKQGGLNLAIVWSICIFALAVVAIFSRLVEIIIGLFEHFEDYVPPIPKVPTFDCEYGTAGDAAAESSSAAQPAAGSPQPAKADASTAKAAP